MKYRMVISAILIVLFGVNAHAQMSFCFKSSENKNLKIKFTVIDKDWKYGCVQYDKQEYAIFVKLKYDTVLHEYSDHPSLIKYVWEEIVDDSVTGIYQFNLQGASFDNIYYTRKKDKKRFKFESTGVGLKDCDCDW